jgi:hypothetical protein
VYPRPPHDYTQQHHDVVHYLITTACSDITA